MNEKTTYLAFKDKKGKVISVAKKTEVRDEGSALGLYLQPANQLEAFEINEAEYNSYLIKLTSGGQSTTGNLH